MSTKTNKSLKKRLKVRRKAGVQGRRPGLGHNNAKKKRKKQLNAKKPLTLNIKNKDLARFLPHS